MILAAGYGTRLQPLTNHKPKALVEIDGIPLLQLIIAKLIKTGVDEIIINTHHFADQIAAFLHANYNFGIRVELSHEDEILGTGGGLKKASYFFNDEAPFFLHNVDIVSTIDLKRMYRFHQDRGAMVTLAIQSRETSRGFIMDEQNAICGHEDRDNQRTRLKRAPKGKTQFMAFCGIHAISPEIFRYIDETGRFSIIDAYLNLIEQGFPILGFHADDFYWKDIGKLETLEEIQQDLKNKTINWDDLLR
ncbi:nucleotidyltransferase family protein [candidate division KSB1 bacterium]|nr:nucleotidyltransferase family protein [candidate division KSB1 bacterium]